jgi:hypothetical protein
VAVRSADAAMVAARSADAAMVAARSADAAMVAARSAAEVAVVAGLLLAAEVAVASVVAVAFVVAVAAAAWSLAGGTMTGGTMTGGTVTRGTVTRGTEPAAHRGERAARAKSHDLTPASPRTLLSCDQPFAGCEFKVALGSNREELTASICFPLCPRTRTFLASDRHVSEGCLPG